MTLLPIDATPSNLDTTSERVIERLYDELMGEVPFRENSNIIIVDFIHYSPLSSSSFAVQMGHAPPVMQLPGS
jgi:hypothetical protein